ncbi:MAG TPA: tetratricopeptide repeat protein [Bryobacteraceae bacterium]|nr:tetratricopeptide repeat protein [Bryobacteraceae bacterium]
MARLLGLVLFFGCFAFAQQQLPNPPEEDESLATTEYAFNPLQAEKEVKVGEFYAKKGSWKAASLRFREATRWNPGLVQAWLRLGDAEEKLKNRAEARKAWATALQLEPNHERAKELRNKIGKAESEKKADRR